MGEMERAAEHLHQGERVANAVNHLYSKVPLAIVRGQLLLQVGPRSDAVKLLEPVVALCRDNNFAGQTMRVLTALGHGYVLEGRPRDAVPLLQEAIALQEAAGAFVDRALWVRTLGEAYRRAGQLDEAESTARSALDFAVRQRERGQEAWVHALLGDIALDRDDPEGARRELAHAQGMATELGMRLLVACCDLRLGAVARRSGAADEARERLSAALSMFRDIGARAWLEQAESELRRGD